VAVHRDRELGGFAFRGKSVAGVGSGVESLAVAPVEHRVEPSSHAPDIVNPETKASDVGLAGDPEVAVHAAANALAVVADLLRTA